MSRSVKIPPWVDDVLRFWFDEVGQAAWFVSDPGLDERIRRRFDALHAELAASASEASAAAADDALATIIVLDQFSRNMYRGTPAAFASDPLALAIARAAVAAGFDRGLDKHRRLFLYLPFEHSEDRAMQARSMELIGSLGDPGLLDYARQHRDVVERFGRFPHRNRILGRASTAEETEFLRDHRGF